MNFLLVKVLITMVIRGIDKGRGGSPLDCNSIFLIRGGSSNISGGSDSDSNSGSVLVFLYFLLYQLIILLIVCHSFNGIASKDNILVILIHIFLRIFPCLFFAISFLSLISYYFCLIFLPLKPHTPVPQGAIPSSELMAMAPRTVAINYIFSLKWIYYGQKQDILDYWGTLICC